MGRKSCLGAFCLTGLMLCFPLLISLVPPAPWLAALLLFWAVLLLFAAVWLMQRFNWVVTPELIRDSILLKFFAENNPIGLSAAL